LVFERRSQGLRGAAATQVILVDVMGELTSWYQLGDVAMIGGTWAPVGGHNPLEPLALGKPVLFGPHTHNAASMFEEIAAQGFGRSVKTPRALWSVLDDWLDDDEAREQMGQRALVWLASQRGAALRTWRCLQADVLSPTWALTPAVHEIKTRFATCWLSERLGPDVQQPALACRMLNVRRLAESKDATVLAAGSGRGQALSWTVNDLPSVLRHYWRGGLIGHFNPDVFVGATLHRSRSMAEFSLLRHMRAWDLPVPEPLGARRVGALGLYRADIAVARINNSDNLVQRLRHQALSASQWMTVGQTVRRLHDRQVFHSDLNAHNLLIDDNSAIWVVDFDRCAVRPGQAWKADNLARLLRSLRKEQGRIEGLNWAETDWADLMRGYES